MLRGLTCRQMAAVVAVAHASAAWAAGPESVSSARYHLRGAGERSKRLVADLRITQLGRVTRDEREYADWQMDVMLDDGRALAVRAVSERAPMTSSLGCGTFLNGISSGFPTASASTTATSAPALPCCLWSLSANSSCPSPSRSRS